jgi:hypothetical protein
MFGNSSINSPHLSACGGLLWDRYFDEFNHIMYDLEKQRGMEEHFPFKS